LPLVAIERASGSVSEICLSSLARTREPEMKRRRVRIAQRLIGEGLDRHDATVLAENYDRTARVERDVVP
jgi:hypothetical protein